MTHNHSTRRNIIIVTLLFGLAAGGICLTRLIKPFRLLDTPDLAAKRLDKENNAYFTLLEAINVMPQDVPPQPAADGHSVDQEWKPQPGSNAELLGLWRPDDDPLVIEYISKLGPATDLARKAAKKPWYLLPAVDWASAYPPPEKRIPDHRYEPFEIGPEYDNHTVYYKSWRLPWLLFFQAKNSTCSDDDTTDSCMILQDALMLSWRISAERYGTTSMPHEYIAPILRKASPDHLRRMILWLYKARSEEKPFPHTLNFELGKLLNIPPPESQYAWTHKPVERMFPMQQKLRVRNRLPLYIKASELTAIEYFNQKQNFEDIETAHDLLPLPMVHVSTIRKNTDFCISVDALCMMAALELYHQDNGAYPQTLASLAPAYLQNLPAPEYQGDPYAYRPAKEDDYVLYCNQIFALHNAGVSAAKRKVLFHCPPRLKESYWLTED